MRVCSLGPRPSAFYSAAIEAFLAASPTEILGQLAQADDRDLEAEQKHAWEDEVRILQIALTGLDGTLFLEFDVPRLGSRIDAVVISGAAIFPLEFKCGQREYHRADIEQAWDYALDLKNFHLASHQAPILPVLIATHATWSHETWKPPHADDTRQPLCCNAAALDSVLRHGLELANGAGPEIDGQTWGAAPYHPTPTIIEAARALYARHSVDAISRHDAGAKNLSLTSASVEAIIERSRAEHQKAIVFVTGVPGAGKTLVGLNVATRRREFGETRAVFLSGNGPLVAVLQEALIRDELARTGNKERKGAIRQKVKPFIQNVHHFRDEGIRRPDEAPFDHVVIFDEAQRAWNREKTSDFMKRRKKVLDFDRSEPEFLISYLDRHRSWAVIICLVGGGQEIHTGEAGIAAWLEAVRTSFPHWHTWVSPDLTDSEYAAMHALDAFADTPRVVLHRDSRLHLASSMRSFRSERVSAFVKALLDCDIVNARAMLADVLRRYPIAVTRDLARAKQWIREHARGSERYGLVASSQAQRLKPHAIDVRVEVDPIHWFLDDRRDTRSSYYLEDAATEFQIQGLELDWVCVTWDADLRLEAPGTWRHHSFRGDSWQHIRKSERKQYLLNAYRVLLTRARQGMVIFVPAGDEADPTRLPDYYDPTFEYLRGLGMVCI
ncbi:MAG: DUF2075 domain-containing protein [Acidobacteria bacterium]|nr:DUF2075 domain-containing protein [Acidobacteriota bacterium]